MTEFRINLFETGECESCLFSFFCPICAVAQARTSLDDSSYLFNAFCCNLPTFRWITRSAYGIGNSHEYIDDCLLSTFCPCCVVNQLYQTTQQFKNPASNGGLQFNTRQFSNLNQNLSASNCLYNTFCPCCAIGRSLNGSIGMPFYLACCCTPLFLARNLTRYQHRIKGEVYNNDCLTECLLPCVVNFGSSILGLCVPIPCFQCLIWYSFTTFVAVQILNESQIQTSLRGDRHLQYLAGYSESTPTATFELQSFSSTNPIQAASVVYLHEEYDGMRDQEIKNEIVLSQYPTAMAYTATAPEGYRSLPVDDRDVDRDSMVAK